MWQFLEINNSEHNEKWQRSVGVTSVTLIYRWRSAQGYTPASEYEQLFVMLCVVHALQEQKSGVDLLHTLSDKAEASKHDEWARIFKHDLWAALGAPQSRMAAATEEQQLANEILAMLENPQHSKLVEARKHVKNGNTKEARASAALPHRGLASRGPGQSQAAADLHHFQSGRPRAQGSQV